MLFIIFCLTSVLISVFLVRVFTFWRRKGIAQKSVYSILLDNICLIFQLRAIADILRSYCSAFDNRRYCGGYQLFSPILYLNDPELIKQITIQDFDHFVDHNQSTPEDLEPLWAKNLLALKGDRWREMRATLSPSFTSSKMRAMFTLISDCAEKFAKHFQYGKDVIELDLKDSLSRFANDVIASTAFGVECNSLKDRNNEFYLMGMEATNFRGLWRALKLFLMMFTPKLVSILGIRLFSPEVSEFFRRLVKSNIESREKQGVVRPDMIHLLMLAKKEHLEQSVDAPNEKGKSQKRHLTDDDLTAQALIFFFAGFESISNFMCFVLYELAVNPNIQETLRQEVLDTSKTGLSYEAIQKMKYMDMVVSETLRKWPPAVAMDRVCVKPYTIQPAHDTEQPVHLQPGDVLWVPTYAIHRNPKFYPVPERFDPERFSESNKANLNAYAFIPFGSGPRSCIGNRFALLESKTLLFHILCNFEIVVTEKTVVPLRLATNQFNLFSEDGFLLGFKPLPIKSHT